MSTDPGDNFCGGDMARIVKCPNCRRDVEWHPDNPYRPFCSQRCKLIDLGEWAREQYTVVSEEESVFSESLDVQKHF